MERFPIRTTLKLEPSPLLLTEIMAVSRRTLFTLIGVLGPFWPNEPMAQQRPKTPIVGVLWHAGNAQAEGGRVEVIQQGLADFGYVDGQNIKLIHTFASEDYKRFIDNASVLSQIPVDVILAVTPPAAMAAQEAIQGNKLPVVFLFVSDPVERKLVQSLSRPGGNITGLSNFSTDLVGKRLQMLNEATGLSRLALLVNRSDPRQADRTVTEFRAAADALGISLVVVDASTPNDLEFAFNKIVQQGVAGVILQSDAMFLNERKQIAQLALARRIAAMGVVEECVKDGVMVSYAPNPFAAVRRSAAYIHKILTGTKPSELPVEQPTKLDLVINLKTAEALGFTLPAKLRLLADKLID